jgi:hypothetical protein
MKLKTHKKFSKEQRKKLEINGIGIEVYISTIKRVKL